jgi:SpoVK/Ycf46/Vps4 family AAA+-type ATPase
MPCADDLNVDTIDKQSPKSITPLTDDQRLLTVATLRGYSLKDKKWLILFLDKIRSNTFSSEAFSSLVLEDQQKDLVLALTTAQRKHKNVFDDIVAGKGRGMIMLLAGPPGVGKTLTAESVAEVLEVPLYVVGAGDLGDQGRNVERNLQKILEMCARWKAVCLIDEADVFLEARNANDLERNKLVSIFLRTLEYYEGILFLTTNRVDNIDAAFQSRIHLSLAYPDLTPASRRQVWSNFINKAAKTSHASEFKDTGDKSTATAIARPDFSDEDLDRLCNFKMNGREIKNVLKTAQLLATMKEEGLTVKHIETVMKVEQRYQGKL